MLASPRRLTTTAQFQQIFKEGRAARADGLVAKTLPTPGVPTRFGVVVSKKVAKEAVKRNRIRRLLREALRKNLGGIKEGYAVALLVLPNFQPQTSKEAEVLLLKLFKKAGLLSP
ncbi:ribonuclease P protein component [Patescibacteria group bacterium]|nr:ribonuclease P protein component [Patescibacteria group bacterium]